MDPCTFPLGSRVELAGGLRGVVKGHTAQFVKVLLHDGSMARRMPKNLKDGWSTAESNHITIHEISDEESESTWNAGHNFASRETEGAVVISDSEESGSEESSSSTVTRRGRHQKDLRGKDFPFDFGENKIGHFTLLHPDQKDALKTQTLAGEIFGDRLARVDFASKSPSKLKDFKAPTEVVSNRCTFELLGAKVHSERSLFGRATRPECYYVVTGGPGLQSINIEDEMNKITDFASIESPGKMASRVELLFSPAKKDGLFELDNAEFEFVEDNTGCSEGNSHAPPSFFKKLVHRKVCKRTDTTVQIRFILGGKLGKGTLTLKLDIDQIQIPPSMVKAGASEASLSSGISLIAVTKCFPSGKSTYMGQYLERKTLSETALDELQQHISPMFKDVLVDKGVTISYIEAYNKRKLDGKKERKEAKKNKPRQSRHPKHLKKITKSAPPPQENIHIADAYVVGISDPTPGAIVPSGHVSVPGLPNHVTSVLVSRSPAMNKSDMICLPVFHTPLLDHHRFGEIIFGNGEVPLPNLIADGDLDGDLYYVIWDKDMVGMISDNGVSERKRRVSKKREKIARKRADENTRMSWFPQMQESASDVGSEVRTRNLISTLYHEAKAEWDRGDDKNYQEYIAYGNAYKASLDLKKHGGTVELPEDLWDAIDKDLRCLLRKPSSYT